MKKAILLISIITLFFAGCKKDDIAEASKLRIETETIEKGWDYVKINVEYDYPVELEAVTLYLSEKEDMSGAEAYECKIEGNKFSVEVKGLKEGVAYYYYEYDNGYEEVRSEAGGLMVITTKDITNVGFTKATCGGDIIYYGDDKITSRGICWSETSEPKINNLYSEVSNNGAGTGSFTSALTNLKANTTYYVRAYATNEAGTVYGEVKSFKTLDEEPEETISGTENGHDYVDLGLPSGLKWATCNVGASSPEEYGGYYAWGETTTKIEYTEENCLTFGKQMNDISGNTQYDAATANWGGAWRMPTYDELNELNTQCTWTWTTQDGVNGYKVEGPNGNSIFLPAAGHRYGSSLYNAENFGYYWSSTPYENFDYDAYYLYFSSASHDMSSNDRYYGRSVRPVFGGNFTGPEEQPEIVLPTVSTNSVSSITANTAICGGNVTSDGGGTVTARGVCWSTSQNPTISNNRTANGIGTGNFTSNLSNLAPQTTYYVRAYATNEAGTSY